MGDFAAQQVKVGTFDWITEFDDINGFLEPTFTGLGHIAKHDVRVLVAGCGTSVLSIQLADSGFGEIVSVDNDSECISHMKNLHHNDQRLQWFTYDMVDPSSTPLSDELSNNDLGLFDMIVDKGTLDAILVEGLFYMTTYESYFAL
jgi:2-polyprenyl-3-methyl-5-hydroxy-6-metoxy-1,4-benzoquinol methylase